MQQYECVGATCEQRSCGNVATSSFFGRAFVPRHGRAEPPAPSPPPNSSVVALPPDLVALMRRRGDDDSKVFSSHESLPGATFLAAAYQVLMLNLRAAATCDYRPPLKLPLGYGRHTQVVTGLDLKSSAISRAGSNPAVDVFLPDVSVDVFLVWPEKHFQKRKEKLSLRPESNQRPCGNC